MQNWNEVNVWSSTVYSVINNIVDICVEFRFFNLFTLMKTIFHNIVDVCVEFCFLKKQFLNLIINMQLLYFITPHAQRERGKVINCGVHIYTSNRKTFY